MEMRRVEVDEELQVESVLKTRKRDGVAPASTALRLSLPKPASAFELTDEHH